MVHVPEDTDECWLWLGTVHPHGNGTVKVGSRSTAGGRKSTASIKTVHVLSYEHFIGEVPRGQQVRQRCGNQLCVNPGHLYLYTLREKLLSFVRHEPNGCWVWTGSRSSSNTKYGQLGISDGKKSTTFLAHRVSFEEFIGPIPNGLEVCHTCDNPPCINPDHLFLGTRLDNMKDAMSKGRMNLDGLAIGHAYWKGRKRTPRQLVTTSS